MTSPGRIALFRLTAATGCLFLVAAVGLADDGPFGLPDPYDPKHRGSVMLHGGGYGVAQGVADEFARLAGGSKATIVLMPSDEMQRSKDSTGRPTRPESMDQYTARLIATHKYGIFHRLPAEGKAARFEFLVHDVENDQDDSRFYELLSKATGVWLPAYDQEWLPQRYASEYPAKLSRFQLALREVVAKGGIVGGLGGGMSSLAETVIAGDAPDEKGWNRAETRFGLALFTGAIVDQNFASHQGRLERLTDLLRHGKPIDRLANQPGVSRRTIGLGVERQTVMILSGDTVRVMGDGAGHVFLKGNGDRTITWRKIQAGKEAFALQTSVDAANSRRAAPTDDRPSQVENPFGMPATENQERLGMVVLHGGGDTSEMYDLLPTLAAANIRRKLHNSAHAIQAELPRMVHCPAAVEEYRPRRNDDRREFDKWFREDVFSVWHRLVSDGRLASLDFVTTNSPLEANSKQFVKPLERAHILWFSGGDQEDLARLFVDWYQPTSFQENAMGVVKRGGVVGGTSAGLAIMAKVMIADNQEGSGPTKAIISQGLGILENVLAEQHFDARTGRIERLTDLLGEHDRLKEYMPDCDPKKLIGLAVEEDTALLVQGPHLRVTGKKAAHVFLQRANPQEIVWHALLPGDAAVLLGSARGFELQLEDWAMK